MTPMLGIMASQISGHLWAPSGAYDSIATATVGSGGSSTITFSSIPSTYTHLQIRLSAQSNRGDYVIDRLKLKINSDTGANYSAHYVNSNALLSSTTPGVSGLATQTVLSILPMSAIYTNVAPWAAIHGAGIIDILDYANVSKYKTVRAIGGNDSNGTPANYGGYVELGSGLWQNTSAITQLDFTVESGTLFNQYSTFALYGIKGA